MNEPTLIMDEGGIPILEQCEGVIMPADYSFKCINNYVHCESPQYEDLQSLALGMSSHIDALKKENERLRGLAITAEKWRGIATAKFGDGRTVSEIEREACEALRKENEQLREILFLGSVLLTRIPYMDDGEMQDNSAFPHIDYKRDSVATIRAKRKYRTWRALKGGAE